MASMRALWWSALRPNPAKPILSKISNRSYQRQKIENRRPIEAVAEDFDKHANNIVVMTGAGISTASGIPDFRWTTINYTSFFDLKMIDSSD